MKGVENESRMTRTAMEIKIKQLENVIAVQNWTINLYQEAIDSRKGA